jgi:hypothetical protein
MMMEDDKQKYLDYIALLFVKEEVMHVLMLVWDLTNDGVY